MKSQNLVLEPSTNTHTLTNVVAYKELAPGIIQADVAEGASLLHGEHGTIAIQEKNVLKMVQQELNPITKQFRNSFD